VPGGQTGFENTGAKTAMTLIHVVGRESLAILSSLRNDGLSLPSHCYANRMFWTKSSSGDDDRLTSTPKSVDYGVVGHHCFECLSGRNLDVRRVAMATNGEWKVLVDILYCVA
jgi:hypothetical protein